MTPTPFATLIGGGAYVLCYLRLQDLLHHALYDLLEEVGAIQQEPLHKLFVDPTIVFGRRHSVLDRDCRKPTAILEDDGLTFLASRQFTELYGYCWFIRRRATINSPGPEPRIGTAE